MLKKLFLYDFRMIARRSRSFLFAALACGGAAFAITLLDFVLPKEGDLAVFLGNTLTAALGGVLIGAFVLLLLAQLGIFSHYYHSFFTEEGYFTFTLPATREQLLLAKILSGGAFTLAVLITATVILLLGILLPFELLMRAQDASFLTALFRSLGEAFSVWSVFSLTVSILSQVVFLYTAITLGALFFAQRKILGACVFYILLSAAVIGLNALFSALFLSFTETGEPYTSLTSMLISLVTGFLGYLIIKTLFTHRLNLT